MRVFLVEDSIILRERLAFLLSDLHGVEVVGQAGDVATAVASIHMVRPDAVILDMQLPGGSGLAVLREIRRSELPTTVVIFTNDPFPQYRQRSLEAGADFFLDKATEFEKLLDIFRSLASSGRGDLEEGFISRSMYEHETDAGRDLTSQ